MSRAKTHAEQSEFKFLSERPQIDSDGKGISFGHIEIISTLEKIVSHCITPFTIGLFGKWGSGKSTITGNLKPRLAERKIPLIIFDVWKHDGDGLKRTFLNVLVRQLRDYGSDYFTDKFKEDPRITSSVTITAETQKIQLGKLIKHGSIIFIILFFVGMALSLVEFVSRKYLGIKFITESGWTAILGGLFTLVSATYLLKYVEQFIKVDKTDAKKERYQDPFEFEGAFKDVLKEVRSSRIVIVFDNLDRISGDNAVKIMSVIKTFLEPVDIDVDGVGVVFLVPCDISAIRRHIDKDENYADEFLRKFFNTTIFIPEFYLTELEVFASSKLAETAIPSFKDPLLSWLIVQVFRDNPRQIIQFINVLVSNYLMLKDKTVAGSFHGEDFYKKNIPQLAKYLLLLQRFPMTLDEMKKRRIYQIPDQTPKREKFWTKDFQLFMSETNQVKIDTFEPFFTFKISEQERELPGISKILFAWEHGSEVESGDMDIIIRNQAKFHLVLRKTLAETRNPVSVVNFISAILNLTKSSEFILDDLSFQTIQTRLDSSVLRHLDKISPTLLTSEFIKKYKYLNARTKTEVIKRWIDILTENSYDNESSDKLTRAYANAAYEEAFRFTSELPIEYIDKFQAVTMTVYRADWEMYEKFYKNKTVFDRIFPYEYFRIFVESIPNDQDGVNILREIKNQASIDDRARLIVVSKLNDILIADIGTGTLKVDDLDFVFFQLHILTSSASFELTPTIFAALITTLRKYNGMGVRNACFVFPVAKNLKKKSIELVFDYGFLNPSYTIPIDGVNFVVKCYEAVSSSFFDDYENVNMLINASSKDKTFLKFYPKVQGDYAQKWITDLIQKGHASSVVEVIIAEGYTIPDKNTVKQLASERLKTSLNASEREPLFVLSEL